MLIIQGLALNQLFSPFYLWPPKINLPEVLDESEPLEYEINLDPGPMGPKPMTKPAESAPNSAESAAAQTQPAAALSSAPTTPAAASPSSPEQSSPAQPIPEQPSPAQTAAVVSIARSTPAPQPLLAVEATPAPSAPDIVLVPSLDVAAASTTEQPAEERGAPGGAPANSDAVSTPVRPLALEPNAAPDRVAAAPISILPGVQALNVEPVIAANPVVTADQAIDRIPVDLTIAKQEPVLSPIAAPAPAPAPALDVSRPLRVPPANPAPDLRVEQVPLSPNKFRVAKPAAPAAAVVRPVLTSAPSKVSASESVRLEVARDEIGRPTMAVQAPIAATDAQAPVTSTSDTAASVPAASVPAASERPAPEVTSTDSSSAQSSEKQSSTTQARNVGVSNLGAPSSDASSAQNSPASSPNEGTSALPADPFARPGSGSSPRDLLGQGATAAAAQVGENAADSYSRGNGFRRYHDPFADDAPNPLAGLRLREPQMFSDVSRFLVKTFGQAALGFAVGASSEIDDFSGPNTGVLIEQWIQQHHSDLQRECRIRQETMDEHIRRLLCGEP